MNPGQLAEAQPGERRGDPEQSLPVKLRRTDGRSRASRASQHRAGDQQLQVTADVAVTCGTVTSVKVNEVQGPDHLSTPTSRNNLSAAYRAAGWAVEAIPLFEQSLADRGWVLGPDHPDTLASRDNLASAYRDACPAK